MFSVGVASYFTIQYSSQKSEEYFNFSGLFWGIATAVKTSTTLFIPSFLYLFLSEGLNKDSLRKGIRFIGLMLFAYLIIGFPQNFGFYKHIKFLLSESKNSRTGNIDSMIYYLTLVFDQTKYLILAFIPVHVLFGTRERLMNKKFLIFLFIGFVVLLARRMVVPSSHHPMPFSALVLITAIFTIKLIPTCDFKYKNTALLVLSILGLFLLRNLPESFAYQLNKQTKCRPEAIHMLKLVKEMQKDGSMLGREPYFPFNSSNKLSYQFWGASLQELDAANISIFGSKRVFGEQFVLEGPQYNMNENALNWKDKQVFYQKVLNDNSFTTPKGMTFNKVLEDQCGFMLWKRVQ
jgi:hypothetical protein